MTIRKRTWTTAKGEQREAWVVDYTDQVPHQHRIVEQSNLVKASLIPACITAVLMVDGKPNTPACTFCGTSMPLMVY